MPTDMRWRILIFTGDINNHEQKAKVKAFAERMDAEDAFAKKFTPKDAKFDSVFDFISIWYV